MELNFIVEYEKTLSEMKDSIIEVMIDHSGLIEISSSNENFDDVSHDQESSFISYGNVLLQSVIRNP